MHSSTLSLAIFAAILILITAVCVAVVVSMADEKRLRHGLRALSWAGLSIGGTASVLALLYWGLFL